MCGLKILSLFMCGILQVNMSDHLKKDISPFIVRQNEDMKKNLEEGIIATHPTTVSDQIMNCVCSRVYDPVCGSNNKSYYNICQLQCENQPGTVHVLHQGNCIPF